MEATRMAIPIALILLLSPLAGCIGGDDADIDPDQEESEPLESTQGTASNETFPSANASDDGEDAPKNARHVVSYQNLDGPLDETIHHEGSFAAHESCVGGGCALQIATGNAPHQERVDVTSETPTHVPVRITVNVTYEGFSGIGAFIDAQETTFFDYDSGATGNETGSTAWATALVVLSGSSELYAGASAGFTEPPQQDYEMEVTLEADPATIPEGVPVAVDLGPTDHRPLIQLGEPSSSTTLRAWGPDDGLLFHADGLDADETIPLNIDQSGEHVLAATGEDTTLRVAASNNLSTSLRALTLGVTLGDAHEVQDGSASWEPTIDPAPYAVGVYLQGESPTFVSSNGEVELASPNGTVVTTESNDFLCLVCPQGAYYVWVGERLHEDIVAGQWTGEASFEQDHNVQVGHLLLQYER